MYTNLKNASKAIQNNNAISNIDDDNEIDDEVNVDDEVLDEGGAKANISGKLNSLNNK